jgi:hypothetical protein
MFVRELAFELSGYSLARIGKRKTPQGEQGLSFGVSKSNERRKHANSVRSFYDAQRPPGLSRAAFRMNCEFPVRLIAWCK